MPLWSSPLNPKRQVHQRALTLDQEHRRGAGLQLLRDGFQVVSAPHHLSVERVNHITRLKAPLLRIWRLWCDARDDGPLLAAERRKKRFHRRCEIERDDTKWMDHLLRADQCFQFSGIV